MYSIAKKVADFFRGPGDTMKKHMRTIRNLLFRLVVAGVLLSGPPSSASLQVNANCLVSIDYPADYAYLADGFEIDDRTVLIATVYNPGLTATCAEVGLEPGPHTLRGRVFNADGASDWSGYVNVKIRQ